MDDSPGKGGVTIITTTGLRFAMARAKNNSGRTKKLGF
jgi:hypothetical protein